MFLRKVIQTKEGPIVDYYPGHIPDYLLFVRIDDTKISELEESLPNDWRYILLAENMGDRRGYSFKPRLTSEEIKNLTAKLVELGAQSFEFRDWTNKISPPTKERVIRTKHPI